MQRLTTQSIRRPKMNISSYSINCFHLKRPWVVALWSFFYPGFGHLRSGSIVKGMFLFSFEFIINYQAHLNLAILYSFTGNFQQAKEVLNTQWLLMYCAILIFSVWDSYRLAVETNKLSLLADRKNAPITPTVIGSFGIDGLDKRNPWVGVMWSLLLPGLAHLYDSQAVKAIFILIAGVGIVIMSHVLQAIGYTAIGEFAQAKAVLDWQWLLNVPSFYGFAAWDAYIDIVQMNQLFEIEQARYLKNNFQNPAFALPFPKQGE